MIRAISHTNFSNRRSNLSAVAGVISLLEKTVYRCNDFPNDREQVTNELWLEVIKKPFEELMDVIFFFMASVPFALFGLQTKNIHWDRTPFSSNSNLNFLKPDTATCPTAPSPRLHIHALG